MARESMSVSAIPNESADYDASFCSYTTIAAREHPPRPSGAGTALFGAETGLIDGHKVAILVTQILYVNHVIG